MPDIDALSRDARDDPTRVRRECIQALSAHDLPQHDRLGLLHALGWAELELGDLAAAWRAAEQATDLVTPSDELAIEIGYLSGVIRVSQGQPELAVEALHSTADSLAIGSEGDARIEMTLAVILAEAGQPARAVGHFEKAIQLAESADDQDRLERILNNRAIMLMQIGRFDESRRDLAASRALAERNRRPDVLALLEHNLGALSARSGDLPQAIVHFESARDAMDQRSTRLIGPALVDEAQLLLDGGLLDEAQQRAIEAANLYADAGAPARQIEAIFLVIRSCVAQNRFASASRYADQAATIARQFGFDSAVIDAMDALGHACALIDGTSSDLTASGIESLLDRVPDIVDIAVEFGVRALFTGAGDVARTYFDHVLHEPSSSSALNTLDRRVASCGLDLLDHQHETAVRRAAEGLERATTNAIALGVTEFRTMASRRLQQLATLGVRAALEIDEPEQARTLLEQARRVELLPEPNLSDAERELVAQLRLTVARLATRNLGVRARVRLLADRTQLEADLRSHRRRSSAPVQPIRPDHSSSTASHVEVDLHAVGDRVCALISNGGDVRAEWIDDAAELKSATAKMALALDANAHEGCHLGVGRFVDQLRALLSGVLPTIDAAPLASVVLDPQLGQIPWSLLSPTPVAVSPSHRHYAAGVSSRTGVIGSIGIVVGPGLKGADPEAQAIAQLYPNAVVLRGRAATGPAVQQLLGEVDLIHFASHGRFRADNPLMSHLEMATGPLSFVDLMEQTRVPERMIFSACHLGSSPNAAAVGLSGLLFNRGCTGFVAAAGPTNDLASVDLMVDLHRSLKSDPSLPLATALRHAQQQASSSPSMARYLAYGAG